MIKFEHVTKTFVTKENEVTAVNDVSLEIDDGEIFGFIGFSGAGKSTLVRCINLLERPDSGSVYVDGTNLMELKDRELRMERKKIGMIFQQFNLLSQRNIIQNVCYPLEISGTGKKEAVTKARELLALVGLSDKETSYPSQLSGGQKQRVAIARALATNPSILLCDEATSALDPVTTEAILTLLKEINTKLGVTIVIITHEMKVVEKICDRVAILSEGVIEEIGSVKEVFENPKSATGKSLVMSRDDKADEPGQSYVRIVFQGESSSKPVFSELVLASGERLNILGANTRDIGGNAYGQLFIEKPSDAALEKVRNYLETRGIRYEEVEVKE
ncbi:MAG: methionine ABC transporter ATP-binding protein [Eubacteriales bacterium]|nr:methionine ABC transporter ATP-binding protein [Eubacteriales bacterium]